MLKNFVGLKSPPIFATSIETNQMLNQSGAGLLRVWKTRKCMNTKKVNLFTSNLEGKALRVEKSETKKATAAALADFAKSIEAEFTKVIKAEDRRARNVANAAKGQFRTALAVVENCFPYQTETGVLCRKVTLEDGSRVWAEKKLSAVAARSIVRDSLKNFTDTVGAPVVLRVAIGEPVA